MNKDFDNIFKSKLENYSSDYPSNLWDNIESELHPVKKRRPFWLYALALLGIILIVGGVTYFSTTSNPEVAQETSLLEKVVADTQSELNVQFSKELKSSASSPDVYTSDSVEFVEHPISIKYADESNKVEKLKKNETDNLNPITSVSTNTAFLNDPLNTSAVRVKKDKRQNKRKIVFTEPIFVDKKRGSSIDLNKLLLKSNQEKSKESRGNTSIETIKIQESNVVASSRGLPMSTMVPLNTEQKLDLNLNLFAAKGSDCPSWVKDKMGLYLEAYYSPEVALRSLTAKSRDSSIMQNQIDRNDSESTLLSYSMGARMMFMTPRGISFKIGLNYSQINEKFSYQDPESQRDITVVDTDPITGDTLDIYTYTEFGSEKEEIINRYKSFDLPVLVGFELYKGKKWSYSFDAGIYLNLHAEQRGKFFDPTGQRNWFTSDENGSYRAFKNSLGISTYASAGLMYHWIEGIDFYFKPSIRYFTQSFTLGDYPLNQNYVVLGLNSGIRYRF